MKDVCSSCMTTLPCEKIIAKSTSDHASPSSSTGRGKSCCFCYLAKRTLGVILITLYRNALIVSIAGSAAPPLSRACARPMREDSGEVQANKSRTEEMKQKPKVCGRPVRGPRQARR